MFVWISPPRKSFVGLKIENRKRHNIFCNRRYTKPKAFCVAFLHRIPTTHLSFLVNSNKTVSERAGKEKKKRNVVFYTLQKVRESLFFQEIFEESKKEKRFPEDALVIFFVKV